jgi:putative ABC transport system permease protein
LFVKYVKTENFRLFPQEDVAYADIKDPLAWVSLGFVTDFENQIILLEGAAPADAVAPDSAIEVLVHEEFATELGLHVGEAYMMFFQRETDGVKQTTQMPVEVAGIWRPKDTTSPFWFYTPDAFIGVFLMTEESFHRRLAPYMEDEIGLILWYFVLDGSNVRADSAGPLLTRISIFQQRINALLPNTGLDISPREALIKYRQAASLLTILLYAFSIPILILTLTFIGLVVSLLVSQRRNEVAVLRSRGATALQIVGIAALEGLLLGLVGLAIGLPISQTIAQVIGQTRSFLNFTAQSDLQPVITPATLRFGLIAVGLTLVAQVVPTIGAARHTIVTYKQERARNLRPPWWQRIWLDVLLLIPAAYGAYLLQQQGSIVLLGTDTAAANNDPLQNPLLLLVPALGIFALTLFFLRILPLLMMLLAWLASFFGGVGFLLATRQLARMPGFYTAPMILLVLTLSLSAFTASLAQTLDNHLYDQIYYKYGADLTLAELGQSAEPATTAGGVAASSGNNDSAEEDIGPRWYFLPVSEYLKAPGVQAAARVGNYDTTLNLGGGRQTGTFMGIDRIDFPKVAFWRSDFAPASLGELMNALALASDGVLLPRTFMRQHTLSVGDTVQATVLLLGQRTTLDFRIVGSFDLFPTWYPTEEEPLLMVGNLDYFFERLGGQIPYRVWLKIEPGADIPQLLAGVRQLNRQTINWTDTLAEITVAQESPERQGLFGILSVGFGAAAILTILGFLLYGFFSFRQRFIELGVLRAIGLSSFQMTIFLGWELAFLILTGLTLGTALGAWVSQLFIPHLQIGSDATALIPPFLVEIAWPAILRIYLLFGLLFVAALAVLVVLLLRMKIFRAIKLGETV